MARTQEQVNSFLTAFRNYADQEVRQKADLLQLSNLYTDLGMATLTQGEIDVQNTGLALADVTNAITTAGTLLGQFTPAIRATLNKIGHGVL